jgi:hypothetical protein
MISRVFFLGAPLIEPAGNILNNKLPTFDFHWTGSCPEISELI